jgi:hypothetical protein
MRMAAEHESDAIRHSGKNIRFMRQENDRVVGRDLIQSSLEIIQSSPAVATVGLQRVLIDELHAANTCPLRKPSV